MNPLELKDLAWTTLKKHALYQLPEDLGLKAGGYN